MNRFFQFLENQKTYSQTRVLQKLDKIMATIFINNFKSSHLFNDSSYKDSITYRDDGTKVITYTGTSSGKKDPELMRVINNGDEIQIFYRHKPGPFTLIGSTRNSRVVRARSVPVGRIPGSRKWHAASADEILITEFVVEPCLEKIIKVNCSSFTKYKNSCLLHSGLFDPSKIRGKRHFDGFYTRDMMYDPINNIRFLTGSALAMFLYILFNKFCRQRLLGA